MALPDVPEEIQKVIGPFIKRAKELDQYQPVISYFAKLYSAQLILEGKYHLQSEGVAKFTETLLNEIEEDKKDLTESSEKIADLIDDNEKSFKLVLGFSNVIFTGADKKVREGKADKRTALDFKAASDFYQLLHLWNEQYEEKKDVVEKRVKYSKYQCARILKSIRNGEDPNGELNSEGGHAIGDKSDEKAFEEENQTDQTVPDLPPPPTELADSKPIGIDSIPNETDKARKRDSITGEADNATYETGNVELPDAPRKIEGELDMPEAPVLIKGEKNHLGLPTAPTEKAQPVPRTDFGSKGAKSSPFIPRKALSGGDEVASRKTEVASRKTETGAGGKIQIGVPANSSMHKQISKQDVDKIWKQEEIIGQAQKRAKFAINALNYDDIPTAISELEKALELLRAK